VAHNIDGTPRHALGSSAAADELKDDRVVELVQRGISPSAN
jgi:hypothetical protein